MLRDETVFLIGDHEETPASDYKKIHYRWKNWCWMHDVCKLLQILLHLGWDSRRRNVYRMANVQKDMWSLLSLLLPPYWIHIFSLPGSLSKRTIGNDWRKLSSSFPLTSRNEVYLWQASWDLFEVFGVASLFCFWLFVLCFSQRSLVLQFSGVRS